MKLYTIIKSEKLANGHFIRDVIYYSSYDKWVKEQEEVVRKTYMELSRDKTKNLYKFFFSSDKYFLDNCDKLTVSRIWDDIHKYSNIEITVRESDFDSVEIR